MTFFADTKKKRVSLQNGPFVLLPQALCRVSFQKEGERRKMSDKRRFGVIECRRVSAGCYHLMVGSELWAEVEWSPARRCFCIQDAAGQCLAHPEHVVATDRDPRNAIRIAKRMIIDGSMPSPEEARQQLKQKQQPDRHRELWVPLPDKIPVKREP